MYQVHKTHQSSITSRLAHAAGNVRRVSPATFGSEDFLLTECGDAALDKYVAQRSKGSSQFQAFQSAFGEFFMGESPDIGMAAMAFETTEIFAQRFATLRSAAV